MPITVPRETLEDLNIKKLLQVIFDYQREQDEYQKKQDEVFEKALRRLDASLTLLRRIDEGSDKDNKDLAEAIRIISSSMQSMQTAPASVSIDTGAITKAISSLNNDNVASAIDKLAESISSKESEKSDKDDYQMDVTERDLDGRIRRVVIKQL